MRPPPQEVPVTPRGHKRQMRLPAVLNHCCRMDASPASCEPSGTAGGGRGDSYSNYPKKYLPKLSACLLPPRLGSIQHEILELLRDQNDGFCRIPGTEGLQQREAHLGDEAGESLLPNARPVCGFVCSRREVGGRSARTARDWTSLAGCGYLLSMGFKGGGASYHGKPLLQFRREMG